MSSPTSTANRRHSCRGAFTLPISPGEAFPLFTAQGERDWVPGWEPTYVHPPSGDLELDQVWTTAVDGEETLWSTVTLDRATRRVEYLRITPGSRIARVSVAIDEHPDGCHVTAGYLWTALSDEAIPVLEEFVAGYDEQMKTWKSLAEAWLTEQAAAA